MLSIAGTQRCHTRSPPRVARASSVLRVQNGPQQQHRPAELQGLQVRRTTANNLPPAPLHFPTPPPPRRVVGWEMKRGKEFGAGGTAYGRANKSFTRSIASVCWQKGSAPDRSPAAANSERPRPPRQALVLVPREMPSLCPDVPVVSLSGAATSARRASLCRAHTPPTHTHRVVFQSNAGTLQYSHYQSSTSPPPSSGYNRTHFAASVELLTENLWWAGGGEKAVHCMRRSFFTEMRPRRTTED